MSAASDQVIFVKNFFLFFTRKLRLSNPWRYKAPFLICIPYFIFLEGSTYYIHPFLSILASVLIIIGVAGIGYLTNDLGDQKNDVLINKVNATSHLSVFSICLLFTLFLALSVLPWLYLPFDFKSLALLCLQFALFFMYAFRPFRLKERGILGVIADALYAHVVPAVLASYTFFLAIETKPFLFWYFLMCLGAWQFILGLRNIIFHQLKDYENDRASRTQTFVISYSKSKAESLCTKMLLPLEVSLFLIFCLLISMQSHLFIVLVFLYWLITFIKVKVKKQWIDLDYRHKAYRFLDYLYNKWLPLFVLILLCMQSVCFIPVLFLHLFLFPSDLKTILLNKIGYLK